MKIFLKKVPNLVVPKQANPNEDAAYDIVAADEPVIVGEKIRRPLDDLEVYRNVLYIDYRTNLFIAPEPRIDKVPNHDGIVSDEDISPAPFTWTDVITQRHVKIYPRSSISKFQLILANSVPTIDGGYRGEIMLRFKYYFQPEDMVVIPEGGIYKVYGIVNQEKIYHKGDKIAQMEIAENRAIEFEIVDKLPDSQRKEGGFGSSGK